MELEEVERRGRQEEKVKSNVTGAKTKNERVSCL
jgi:hypothetical protein